VCKIVLDLCYLTLIHVCPNRWQTYIEAIVLLDILQDFVYTFDLYQNVRNISNVCQICCLYMVPILRIRQWLCTVFSYNFSCALYVSYFKILMRVYHVCLIHTYLCKVSVVWNPRNCSPAIPVEVAIVTFLFWFLSCNTISLVVKVLPVPAC